jgi:hypothetical protein
MNKTKNNNKIIVIVTQLVMLKAGNQKLFQTIQGYINYWVC